MCSSPVEMVSSTPLWHEDAIAGFARTETAEARMNSDEIFRFFLQVHITPRRAVRLSWHSRPRGLRSRFRRFSYNISAGSIVRLPHIRVLRFHALLPSPPAVREIWPRAQNPKRWRSSPAVGRAGYGIRPTSRKKRDDSSSRLVIIAVLNR